MSLLQSAWEADTQMLYMPLKRVDAVTVAEAMTELFSRTGLPAELLTDQGSVFTSKL